MAQAMNTNNISGGSSATDKYAAAAKTGKATPSAKETAYATGVIATKPNNAMGGGGSAAGSTRPTGDTWEDTNALARAMQQTLPSGDRTGDGSDPNGFDNLGDNTGTGGYYRGGGSSRGGGGRGGSYTAPVLPTATSQEAYIRSMYDANKQAARENLRSAYETNMAALDREAGRLPETYDTAVDAANTQAAINRLNFNEQAAMSGLNTGAGSQARLSQNNALLGNVSSIRRAQADAQADLDFQRTQMEAQYQQAIREAVAKNDLEKAQALYQEAKRVDESIVNTAINQANLNWNIWRTLYG